LENKDSINLMYTKRNEKLEEKTGNAYEKNWRECKKGG
jgi:hypothetical protein